MTYPEQPAEPNQPPTSIPPHSARLGYPAGQPPAKKRTTLRTVLIVVGIVALLCCGGGAIFLVVGGKAVNKAVKAASTPTPKTGTHAKQGQAARDGNFEFTVTAVIPGKTQVGEPALGQTAQGQFVFVAVTVKNIGKDARTFAGSSQKAFGAGGVTYADDTAAEIAANTQSQTFLQDINPGNQVAGTLVFDIPKTAKLMAVELHDSPLSRGVTVDLT